jgi:hypothetical protein
MTALVKYGVKYESKNYIQSVGVCILFLSLSLLRQQGDSNLSEPKEFNLVNQKIFKVFSSYVNRHVD